MNAVVIPQGCFSADTWARLLNVPLDAVRLGSLVSPFGYRGAGLMFVPCPCGEPTDPFDPWSLRL